MNNDDPIDMEEREASARFRREREELDQLVDRLRIHGKKIGRASSAGDKEADAIISLYSLVSARAEPAAVALCTAALDAWIKKYPQAA